MEVREVGVEDERVETGGVKGQGQDLLEGVVRYEGVGTGELVRLVRALGR